MKRKIALAYGTGNDRIQWLSLFLQQTVNYSGCYHQSVWYSDSDLVGTQFEKDFEAENPDIDLNVEIVSWNDLYTKVNTLVANNNAPDILNIGCSCRLCG